MNARLPAYATAAFTAALLLATPRCGGSPPARLPTDGIVFVAVGVGGRLDVFIAPPSDGSRVNITSTPAADESFPRWSPDGTRIAWICGDRPGHGQLVIADADGKHAAVVEQRLEVRSFAWSPDGEQIAAATFSNGGTIVLIDLLTRTLTRLAGTEAADSPDFSHDGRRLVFRQEFPGNDEIYEISLETLRTRRLTNAPLVNDLSPRFSPHDAMIVWSSGSYPHDAICVMRADGSHQHCLTHGRSEAENPSWSRTGKRIVFDRHGALWAIQAGGGAPRLLLHDGIFADASRLQP